MPRSTCVSVTVALEVEYYCTVRVIVDLVPRPDRAPLIRRSCPSAFALVPGWCIERVLVHATLPKSTCSHVHWVRCTGAGGQCGGRGLVPVARLGAMEYVPEHRVRVGRDGARVRRARRRLDDRPAPTAVLHLRQIALLSSPPLPSAAIRLLWPRLLFSSLLEPSCLLPSLVVLR